jgi:hypothetical protein
MRSNDDDGWIGVLACQSRLCQGKELFQGDDYSCKSVGLGPGRGEINVKSGLQGVFLVVLMGLCVLCVLYPKSPLVLSRFVSLVLDFSSDCLVHHHLIIAILHSLYIHSRSVPITSHRNPRNTASPT